MTIILTPYWSNGVQRLKMAIQPEPKPKPGLIPPAFDEDIHALRCLNQLRSKDKNIEKYIYLSMLKEQNSSMFYKLCLQYMSEFTPLIYTPTVGDACLQYSHIYRRPEGLFISIKDKGNIREVIRSWTKIDKARISVVTDGSRILGLGDLGINGMPISIGKLSLYIAGAGIRPASTIPICLDLGTNNQKCLDDPLYLGLRQKRITGPAMTEFMDEFMHEMSVAFPKLLVQFEDFSTDNAFLYLERYRNKYPVFNDDIQGTGAVVLSGLINAARLSSAASGRPITDHRILFFGAGSAGTGVAMQLMSFFTLNGLSQYQARERIWFIDSQGLVFDARGPMAEHKKFFARKDYNGPPLTGILDIIEYVKPTALLGLSTISNAFTPDVIQAMAVLNQRPIIFPLSNPVCLSECSFQDAVDHTSGQVLFASGSPFPAIEYDDRTLYPGQGNNMYIFPGMGLGAILSRVTSLTDSMVEASSLGLAGSLTEEERSIGLLYPRIERIREISAQIATQVSRAAQKEGVDRSTNLRSMSDAELFEFVSSKMWNP
ncbi:NADP-dependent malic enzyme [Termitomyces sp. J132]|nr:NADP-dependent malic enzyme [Termitomyces sp. J132]